MATRAEQKARTRNALIDSALKIIGVGANFASVSLREVAKKAGVVPTSFYRHFDDMEELGLTMLDELGLSLRRLLRGSFRADESIDEIIKNCMDVYYGYVAEHASLLQFVNQSRTGGTPALREAIRSELAFFNSRIAAELSQVLPTLKADHRETVAGLITSTLMESTASLLSIPAKSSALQAELKERTAQQMRVIMLGAQQLQGKSNGKSKSKSRSREA